MQRPKALGSRLTRPLMARLGNVTMPAGLIRTSKLFDADLARARLLARGLEYADVPAVCQALASESDLFDIDPSPHFDADF